MKSIKTIDNESKSNPVDLKTLTNSQFHTTLTGFNKEKVSLKNPAYASKSPATKSSQRSTKED